MLHSENRGLSLLQLPGDISPSSVFLSVLLRQKIDKITLPAPGRANLTVVGGLNGFGNASTLIVLGTARSSLSLTDTNVLSPANITAKP
ncbi:MAG: hypothetical protein IPJ75_15685 [Ignavibacteriales bacterium]|nr:hypothetical protein [Ignavibacteriales bacterium]